MDAHVVVLGSANLDVTLTVAHMPAAGETVLTPIAPLRAAGGKGLNQAIAAARTGGHRVTFVGAVGDDGDGRFLADRLSAAGVHPMLRLDRTRATGLALVLLEPGGENRIVVASGANLALDDITPAEAREVGVADVLLMPAETPVAGLVEAARAARANGTLVVLNAAPVPAGVAHLVPFVDVLVVNEAEALAVLALLAPDDAAGGPVAPPHEDAVVERLTGWFGTVVVTLGGRGVLWARPGEASHRVAAFDVAAVDTTGAGDTFCGALASALATGVDTAAAIERGVAASALAVQRPGASSAVPTGAEVDALLSTRR
jgi:ribokinase